jgi:hypothetical protein
MKKFMVMLLSKPGLSNPYKSIITVSAEDHGSAVNEAIKKACENPKYKHRKDIKFWHVQFCKTVNR